MKRTALAVLLAAVILPVVYKVAYSHCEVPCGIYDDKLRIGLILEHCGTVEKSMKQIQALSAASNKGDAQSINQVVRWVNNKEEHAKEIQHIVTQYFMTQRVKMTDGNDAAATAKYHKQLSSLHSVLVHAMKCKQTLDVANAAKMRYHTHAFAEAYFNAEDLKYIREHYK